MQDRGSVGQATGDQLVKLPRMGALCADGQPTPRVPHTVAGAVGAAGSRGWMTQRHTGAHSQHTDLHRHSGLTANRQRREGQRRVGPRLGAQRCQVEQGPRASAGAVGVEEVVEGRAGARARGHSACSTYTLASPAVRLPSP